MIELFDQEIENIMLGSIFLNKGALYHAIETLYPADFFDHKNQFIFQTILDLFQKNINIDEVIVFREGKGKISAQHLLHCINIVPCRGENYIYYSEVIRKKAEQRNIYQILEAIKNGKIELEEGLVKIESIPRKEIKEETFSTILEHTLRDSRSGTKYKFNINSLNYFLGGVDKGEIVTIGGFTSQGKTSCAIQLAIDFVEEGKKILYLSSEMTEIEMGRRILANLNKKNLMDFRKGKFEEGEKEAFQDIIDIISKASEKWEMKIKKINDIKDIIKYVRKYKPEILFIDYLQNLGGDSRLSDYQRTTENIRQIQTLTLKEEITTFVLSQMSRQKEETAKPKLNMLRDSGRIEECSNIILLLYWKKKMAEEIKPRIEGEDPEELEVVIGKNRDGTIGKFKLDFWPEYCRIRDKEKYYENYYETEE